MAATLGGFNRIKTMNDKPTISDIDEGLRILREGWMESSAEKKPKWMEHINAALDTRLVAMHERDSKI